MRNLILKWLFGTDDIKYYIELLVESRDNINEQIRLLDAHKRTLDREKWALDTIGKLIRVCENHGIDVDEEIKHIELFDENNEVNANETLGG